MYAFSKSETAQFLRSLTTDVFLMAPCVFLRQPTTLRPDGGVNLQASEVLYKSYELVFDLYDQVGVYAYNGPDKEADTNKLCYVFGKNSPECRRAKKPTGFGQTMSVKAQKHLQ